MALAPGGRSNVFSLNVNFKHSNATSIQDFLNGSAALLGKKDMSKPLQALQEHWVEVGIVGVRRCCLYRCMRCALMRRTGSSVCLFAECGGSALVDPGRHVADARSTAAVVCVDRGGAQQDEYSCRG